MPTISEETHDRCAAVSDQGAETETAVYDIGKIMESDVNFKDLGRDMIYRILTAEVNPEVSCYPRRACRGILVNFNLHGRSSILGFITASMWMGFFVMHVFFAPENVGGQTPGQYVTKPFRLWVNKTQKMNSHAAMAYHEAAMTKMEFLVRYKQPEQSIDVLIDNEAKKRMAMNQNQNNQLMC